VLDGRGGSDTLIVTLLNVQMSSLTQDDFPVRLRRRPPFGVAPHRAAPAPLTPTLCRGETSAGMPRSPADVAVDDVRSEEEPSNLLDSCEAILPLDHTPQVVRFSQFTLFTESKPVSFGPPRLLSLQPQRLVQDGDVLEASFRNAIVKPMVERWESEVPTRHLPDPELGKLEDIQEAIRNECDGARRSVGELRRGLEVSSLERSALAKLIGLPERELRASYGRWLRETRDRLTRERLRGFGTIMGLRTDALRPGRPLTTDEVGDLVGEVVFPGPFNTFDKLHPLVALCSVYEQIWELRGYTRGELLSSLTLAPGERATLEVHSWDKSSRKTEDQLSESEIRTSEKLTQRDALTVVQEYARQRNTNVNANATFPSRRCRSA
jgi:hypothetical protein